MDEEKDNDYFAVDAKTLSEIAEQKDSLEMIKIQYHSLIYQLLLSE
jgi:hypothetical protein